MNFPERLAHWIAHLEHVLPGQAPIRDFVHHNTLHGYAHLPFDQAVEAAADELGVLGFWPQSRFRAEHAAGRIDDRDLAAALDADGVSREATLAGRWSPHQVWQLALRHDCAPLGAERLNWLLEEEGIGDDPLWRAALEVMPPPAEVGDMSHVGDRGDTVPPARWSEAVAKVGAGETVRDLLLQLSGEDVLIAVQRELLRHLGVFLDQGLGAWHHPRRSEGFYAAWRDTEELDPAWAITMEIDARAEIRRLPADPVAAIEDGLRGLGLAEEAWEGYLKALALQLPGWSGMFLWRHLHPGYAGQAAVPVAMADYLAVRLVLERLAADNVARRLWDVPARLPALAAYFEAHPVELSLRLACHRGDLPEVLASRVEQMERLGERPDAVRAAWARLARDAELHRDAEALHRARQVWPLFALARAMGLDAGALRALGPAGAAALRQTLAALGDRHARYLWLTAYERHYAEQVFAALAANHGRGAPPAQPSAQLVLCMDDREEGFRRHLEEADPTLETLGGAAHFGVFQNWRAFGETEVTALCPVVPVVVRPAHEVRELPRDGEEERAASYQRRLSAARAWRDRVLHATRLSPVGGVLLAAFGAPLALAALLARSLAPAMHRRRGAEAPPPPTRMALTAAEATPATPDRPRLGFTDDEQAERIGAFLVNLGLTRHFAPLVAILGHGSSSENNPHLAAYDCGACAGRHSGPNARLFAAMANRPEVRARLAARGIVIPDGTWFLGAEHNTCDDGMSWYDLEELPAALRDGFARLRRACATAGAAHAAERCRRLMSAPAAATPSQGWRHVAGRRGDFAQPRPELGHVTNASALVGRRAMSRGAFLDRRAFLISYDPTQDADGAVLERLLAANGPVGAGISLEYYFSTVNNERFGCGSKVVHNVAGGFGVMAGASSDLRTGLPSQMIEIHEPMRLLVVVEQTTACVGAIYERNPALRELIGKGWLLLAAKDPASPAIHRFEPERGWLPWTPGAEVAPLPTVAASRDWFSGRREPLPPALLTLPVAA